MMTRTGGGDTTNVNKTAVERVLRNHPIQIGVVFGSHVRGTETPESDVDVAVDFDESLSTEDRHQARIDLTVDFMETLGVNDVDVTDLEGTRPAVGASAFETGIVLVGDEARVDRLRKDFESRMADRSHEERMRQFDELLDRIEATMSATHE